MARQKVLISGAGPAGLAAGILLNREKYDVTLIESKPEFSSIGFAIILWKSGYEVLNKILGKTVHGIYPIKSFNIHGGNHMRLLQSINTDNGDSFSIKRADLISQLSDKYVAYRGLESVKFNTEISNVNQSPSGGSKATFNDGSYDIFDVVILSDGINSKVRDAIFKTKRYVNKYKINYLWIKSSTNVKDEARLGIMRNYLYLFQSVGTETLLAYYNFNNPEENEKFLEKVTNTICDAGEKIEVDRTNERIFNSEKIIVKKAYKDNIVLIGDAYHGHPPTLAIGTSLSLEDAYILCNLLNAKDENRSGNLSEILSKFTDTRNRRIRDVYRFQDFVEKIFISRSKIVIWMDIVILKFGAWPLIERKLRKLFTESCD